MIKGKELSKRIFFLLLGSLITAIGINAFIIPHKLLSGGIAGISLVLQYLLDINSGYFIFALNVPIFLIGMRETDRDFTIFSLIGMLFLSVFLVFTTNVDTYLKADEILLSSIYGGVLTGIGIGIVFKNRASQGGTDIIAVVLKKRTGMSIAGLSFAMNGIVVALAVFVSSLEIALYTLITMYISSYVMNRLIEGFERKKVLLVVSQREKEVAKAIINEIGRGVTYFDGEGAYTGSQRKIIYCIVTLRQLPRVKVLIEKIDPQSFISILDASEVTGKGFKKAPI